jgi:hypothetical protein
VKGTWKEGSLAGDPERYVEKALETGISLYRGPILGNLEEGSSTRDFNMWMKGASVDEASLSEEVLWGPWWSFFTGDHGRYVKKVWVEASLSEGAPLSPGNPVVGVGSYTKDFDIPGESVDYEFSETV